MKFRILIIILCASLAAASENSEEAWAVYRMDLECAWAEFIVSTAPFKGVLDTATDRAAAAAVYKASIGPYKEVYFARLNAARAVYEAMRALEGEG